MVVFVGHDNHSRAHESLGDLTPADVYFDRDDAILQERRGSSVGPLPIVDCATLRRLPKLSTQVGQSLRSWALQIV
mgnify:CR=1 FL=1